ncbi:MAG: hypothetical protein HY290_20220 [Planctomycetia bacterium]|nr:hypothetical protein [Planctomycetia bacterium]
MDAAKGSFSDSFGPPHPDNLYLRRAIAKVNSHSEGLWDHLDRVSSLDPAVGRAVLSHFLELYQRLDAGLMRTLARRAIENPCPDIQEAGRSFLDLPTLAD